MTPQPQQPEDYQRDSFWDPKWQEEEARQPWTWPRAFARIGTSLVFWAAVVAILYVVLRYG